MKSPTYLFLLLLSCLLTSCLTLNTHSSIAEYARCFPAWSTEQSTELLRKDGHYYIKAENVQAMLTRRKVDGMIDFGPFASLCGGEKVQSHTGTYAWLPLSTHMARRLSTQGAYYDLVKLEKDIEERLKTRQPLPEHSNGTMIPIVAKPSIQRNDCYLIISPEWEAKCPLDKYYSPFDSAEPYNPSGNYWARPAACLSAVCIDLPASAAMSASAPILVIFSFLTGTWGPP